MRGGSRIVKDVVPVVFMTLSRDDKQYKAERQQAVNDEIERLCELAVAELAVMILPAWGQRRSPISSHAAGEVATWLTCTWPMNPGYAGLAALEVVIREAIGLLERTGLLIRQLWESGGSSIQLTRMGWTALTQGTARHYLSSAQPAPFAGATPPGRPNVPASVIALAIARDGGTAVQRYRELTGAGLRAAEAAVNAITEPAFSLVP